MFRTTPVIIDTRKALPRGLLTEVRAVYGGALHRSDAMPMSCGFPPNTDNLANVIESKGPDVYNWIM